ncbi:copper resistance CopC/CopD family protein [Halobacillus amylolyticus]|uniref:copper resistance CopC/CopD family protein n=1 Tax=Halobacillus amylolyticus TaxID=2932259 RepID=UPI002112C747|nr:copper resistance protein CopC [Halobacillus amylolyticus]
MNGFTLRTCILSYFILFFFLLFAYASPAGAHSSLEETFPKGGEVLEGPPSTIEVWFQDPVVIHEGSIKVINSKGKEVPVLKSEQDPKDAGHVITKLDKELAPGEFTVKINVIAQDGFIIEEEFRFSISNAAKSESEELKLVKSNVSDGEIHKGPPGQIELWFNQPVEVRAIGIFNSRYQPVGTKRPQVDSDNPRHISVPISNTLSPGTYQLTWSASPTNKEMQTVLNNKQGVFYFAVDKFSSMTPENTGDFDWDTLSFSIGLKQLAYWLTFIGLTILFGISWFYSILLKNRLKKTLQKSTQLLFYLVSLVGMTLLIVHHRLDLPELAIKEFLLLKFTWIPILQIILLSLGMWIKKMRLILFGIALILWPFIIGHASYPRYGGYITMIMTAFHIIAVAIWMGGLFSLIAKPKHLERKEWLQRVGPTFSNWAMISVSVILFTGIWMTVEFLPSTSLESFLESEWGRSLLIKTVLFFLLIIIGYVQRKTVKQLSSKFTFSFFKRVRIEAVYGLIIFFFAASLVAANPSAAEQGVYRETPEAPNNLDLNVEITPLEMGLNTITLEFKENPKIRNVKVELSMPPTWQVENNAFQVGKGIYKLTGNLLHGAGTINMKVKVLMENGKEVRLPYTIVVPGEVRNQSENTSI